MATRLDKTLKREVSIDGRAFVVAISPEGVKLTLKGRRKGQELRWSDLISGEAALAVALNASVGRFETPRAAKTPPVLRTPVPPVAPKRAAPPARAQTGESRAGAARAGAARPPASPAGAPRRSRSVRPRG